MLARAHIGRLGARRDTDAVVLLDDHATHAALPKLDGERKADGAGADDQDLGLDGLHCAWMPRSWITLPHSLRSEARNSAACLTLPGRG